MRNLILLPLLLAASPALAQAPAPRPAPAPAPQEIQRVLNDPAMVDRMTGVMQALSRAFLDMPVGEVQAAVEGRPATPADRQRRMRDIEPGVDVDLQQQMAQARPMIQHSMKALSAALPGMMKGMQDAQKSLDRAISNMPDPTYPKR